MTAIKQNLVINKRVPKSSRPVINKKSGVFEDDDDDNGDVDDNSINKSKHGLQYSTKSSTKSSGKHIPISRSDDISTRQTQRKQLEEATSIDPSIYDYDAAFDAIHARDAAKKAAQREAAEKREVKYMSQAMAAAEIRKRDQLQAKDKVLQREREAEGDEFDDKAKFVTGAYKKQQEELRRLEEEEARREEAEARKKKGTGQFLYQSLMGVEDKRHQEAVAAAAAAAASASDPGAKGSAEEPREKSQAELAREINANGGHVVITEDGEVAIKTQLLSAGLNVTKKPQAGRAAVAASDRSKGPQVGYQGRSAGQKAMRERQSRMIEEQLEQAAKRSADQEQEEQRKLEHAAKSRKTEGDISSARERYLQRKREAAAEKGASG
jgi:coiled-coil domain-containing protein 55